VLQRSGAIAALKMVFMKSAICWGDGSGFTELITTYWRTINPNWVVS
jgi:hypothetical protein